MLVKTEEKYSDTVKRWSCGMQIPERGMCRRLCPCPCPYPPAVAGPGSVHETVRSTCCGHTLRATGILGSSIEAPFTLLDIETLTPVGEAFAEAESIIVVRPRGRRPGVRVEIESVA